MQLPTFQFRKETQAHPIFQWMILVIIGVSWGITGPLAKMAVSSGNHPIGITFWDTLITALFLSMILLIQKKRLPMGRRYLIFFFICGLSGTAFPNVLSYTAYKHLPVGVNAIILSLVPLATLLIALPFGIERASIRRITGLALGLMAIMLIYLPQTSLPNPEQVFWVALPIIAAISYAIENVYIASARPPDLNPLMIICGLSWAAVCYLGPLVILTGTWVDLLPMEKPEQAIFGISFLHMFSYMGFVWLIDRAGPVFASQVGYIITLSGVILGMVLFNENHSIWIWSALILIFIGLTLVKPREHENLKPIISE